MSDLGIYCHASPHAGKDTYQIHNGSNFFASTGIVLVTKEDISFMYNDWTFTS